MKNYFVIHGSFGNSHEHWLPWIKDKLELVGCGTCYLIDFPIGVDKQNYVAWAKTLDKYKDKITEETTFIGRSIAPIFIIKYLMENNLHIKKSIFISGFNNYSVDGGDYDFVNHSFFVETIKNYPRFSKTIYCIISENDPYIKLSALKDFCEQLKVAPINVKDGGHFNTDTGYDKFDLVLDLCNKK